MRIPISIPMVILSSYLFLFCYWSSKDTSPRKFELAVLLPEALLILYFGHFGLLKLYFGHHSFHHVHLKGSCRNGIIWSCKVAVEVNSELFMCLLKPLLTSWAINLPRHKFLCAHLDRKEVKLVTRDSEITPMVNLIEKL